MTIRTKSAVISIEGLNLIKQFEGFRAQTYLCSASVPTIGYGHTAMAGLPDPATYTGSMTEAQAVALLDRDLDQYEQAVRRAITVEFMQQYEFDAFVSCCYNIGIGGFSGSSMVRKFNQGDNAGAGKSLLLWNKAGGKVVKGLVNRREAELDLFNGGKVETMPQIVDNGDALDNDDDGIIDVGRVGKCHPSVAAIHRALMISGLPVMPDEFYSQHTASMMRRFQDKHGLQADGVFGAQTRKVMETTIGKNLTELL